MINLTYNGKSFNQRAEDNYVNVGQLCATHGKDFYDWKRTKMAEAYLTALSLDTGIPSDALICTNTIGINEYRGTWAHPLVAVEVARWISPTASIVIARSIKDYGTILKALNDFEIPDDLPEMYVYAIQEVDTQNIKLGISKDPIKRLKQLQTANSSKLELVGCKLATNRYKDEQSLHEEFNSYKIHGEWFTKDAKSALSAE